VQSDLDFNVTIPADALPDLPGRRKQDLFNIRLRMHDVELTIVRTDRIRMCSTKGR
jgi:hypothetical protein